MKSKLTAILFASVWLIALNACQNAGPKTKQSSSKQRPNVIFIILDDASWLHFGAYGSTEVTTPNLDQMAQNGVLFNNAFVSTSSCTPSRAAILTGRNGFELEHGASLWGYLPRKFKTTTEILEQNGYRVGSTGKGWGPGILFERDTDPAGYTYNDIKHYPYKKYFDHVDISDVDYVANFQAFLDSTSSDKPFYFWIGPYEPHRGYTPGLAQALGRDPDRITVPAFMPDSPQVRDDINEYYTEIEHVDAQIARLFAALKKSGHLNNTLILFTSDNGMPFPRAKATLYDYGAKMPLIAWWGNNMKTNRQVNDFINLTDIAPTILEVAGIKVPKEMSGKSFLTQLQSDQSGQIDPSRNKVYMYRERHGYENGSGGRTLAMRAIRNKEFLLIKNYNTDIPFTNTDNGPAKSYLVDNKNRYPDLYQQSLGRKLTYELYDVKKDPLQMENLAGQSKYSKTLNQLENDLDSYLVSRKDPRATGSEAVFRYTPYFGFLFEKQVISWRDYERPRSFSDQAFISALKKSYELSGESENYQEMIKQFRNAFEQD